MINICLKSFNYKQSQGAPLSCWRTAVRNTCISEGAKKRTQIGLSSFNVKCHANALRLTRKVSSMLQGNRIDIMTFNFFCQVKYSDIALIKQSKICCRRDKKVTQ